MRLAAAIVAPAAGGAESRLAAFYVPAGEGASAADLREHLLAELPPYMVPALFAAVEELPLTANGKVDRRALAARAAALESAGGTGRDSRPHRPPRTPAEDLLCRVWSEVLRLERVGIDDDFFALGGDSILSIQVVARAARAGCRITPRQLFEHPTVAELAAVAGTVAAAEAEQGEVTGPVPLTPIQRWFFAGDPTDRHHFNQAILLRLARPLPARAAERAWTALVAHHDALRLRFGWTEASAGAGPQVAAEISQQIAPVAAEPPSWSRIDLSGLGAAAAAGLASAGSAVQASLDLARGPLARAAWLDLPGGAARLLLVVHHLAIDGVSWRVLLDDLETACRQLAAGDGASRSPALPPKTTSFQRWAEELAAHALSLPATGVDAAAAWWTEAAALPRATLPSAEPITGGMVAVALDAETTRALLQDVPAAYRTRIDDALLTALVQALAAEGEALWVDLEGHGREELFPGVDLTRTVGWFTSLYPVALALAPTSAADPGAALRAVKEQLRAVPQRGMSFGLLRHLRGDARLASLPAPQVAFNYLGQLDPVLGGDSLFAPAAEPAGEPESPRRRRDHRLTVNAFVQEGELQVGFGYAGGAEGPLRPWAERLAVAYLERLRALVAHCAAAVAAGKTGATPSDFPLAASALDQPALDGVLAACAGASVQAAIEDLYPLSPLQEGLLFHSLYAPGSGVYVEQLMVTLAGDLDVPAVEGALSRIVLRTPVLRTSFHWRGLARPLQAVHRSAQVALTSADWSTQWPALDDAERRERLAELVQRERLLEFDLGRPPLMRWHLVKTGEGSHRLLWSHHHLLLDGWSYAALIGDFVAAYEALVAGAEPHLPARPPFRDYIAWLAAREGRDEGYWRAALAGWSEPTPIPADRRQSGDSERRRTVDAGLDPAATAALEAAARRAGLTPSTLVQAAWGLVLARYGAVDDVVFGTTVSGRPGELPGVEAIVGLFINTLPIRLEVRNAAPLAAWLADVQRRFLELRQHEQTPLVSVQEWSAVPRGLPLFDSILAYENYPRDASLRSSGPSLGVVDVEGFEQTNYPLTVLAMPDRGLLLRIAYDPGRFDRTTVARLAAHTRDLAAALAGALDADHGARVGDLALLSAAERHQLIREWNDTRRATASADGGGPACLHDLVIAASRRTPDAVALVCEGASVTYGGLERRSRAGARRLAAAGAGRGEIVGICCERSPEMVALVLAVLRAGAAYVALDPEHPPARLAQVLADAGCRLALAGAGLADRLAAFDGTVLAAAGVLARGNAAGDLDERGELGRGAGPGPLDAAYCVYTSGSTGRPKGILAHHGGAVSYLRWVIERYGFGPDDVALQLAPLTFDAAVRDVFAPLAAGARLLLVPRDVVRDPAALVARIAEHGVTALPSIVPSLLRRVVESALAESTGARGGQTVRLVLAAGERLYGADGEGVRAAFGPQARLFNQYGASECTMSSTFAAVTAEAGAAAPAPVGRPIDDAWIAILDRGLDGGFDPAPLGAVGEVAIGGPGLTYGYLGQPERTAEAFTPAPFAAGDPSGGAPGARLYRTGDLGRLLPDGRLEYLGRVDHQVKIRGVRVEPGEIESVLRQHPAVGDAAVVVRAPADTDTAVDPRLAAFVVAREGAAPAPAVAALRAFLKERLPDFMVPADWALLDALPLNPHGKVDRPALARAERELALQAPRSDVRQRTPIEDLVAGIWCELLGHEWVGLEDSFFELGGHSLLATRVTSRLRQVLGVELPIRTLFVAPTLAALAAEVERARAAGEDLPLPPLLPLPAAARAAGLPLSFAQERLWFLDQLVPGSPSYNMPFVLRLRGELSIPALAAALAGLAARHETLRTSFAATDSGPVQEIAPAVPATLAPPLPLVDLSGLAAARREAAAAALAGEDSTRPFDLARGPLLRSTLLHLEPGNHIALFTLHHIVADGWSFGILVTDLGALYTAASAGEAPRLPPLAVQYADVAAWQRGWLDGERLAAELGFWRRRLAGAPAELALPLDRPRPTIQSFRGGQLPLLFDRDLSRAAASLARREGATLFMLLLAAFSTLLSRVCGQEDVVVGSGVANRTHREMEGLIGFFVNSLALRVELAADPSFLDLLAQVRETTLAAYAHQDLPFEKLVAELKPERSLARSPIFQVMLVLQNAPLERLELPGVTLEPLRSDRRTAKFDLTLSLGESADGIAGFFEYDSDLFDPTTAARLAGHFETLLAAAVGGAGGRAVSALPLLSAAEAHQLLVDWNDTASDYPRRRTVDELVAARAAACPGAVALDFSGAGGATITYAELEERAGRLAAFLARRGVAPGARVALFLERSAELVVALLAVVKAGAAYVPLDPTYPRERLAFLVADCGAAVVVTEERLLERLPREGGPERLGRIVVLDRERAAIAAEEPAAGGGETVDAGSPIYVVYTSGSTGRPKGVVVPHRAVVRLFFATDYLSLGPADRVAQTSNASFDVFTFDVWGTLLAGGTLVGMARDAMLSPRRMAEELRARRVSALFLTSALFHQIAAAVPDAFATVTHLLVGGEPVDPGAARRVLAAGPPARLLDAYGPAEATTFSSWHRIREVPAGATSIPIGRPVANTRLHVLDERLRPVPIGVEGELFVAGEGLALGYLDRPELTAERFLASPHLPGERLYRTGDRARRLADGNLDFRGRLDHQVKLRGFRIELGEVETALAELPGVGEAAVLLRDDLPEGRGLVAYLAGSAGMATAAALREALKERLPEPLVPARFVALPALPLTGNGKVDRRALAALPLSPPPPSTEGAAFAAPSTPAEELVAGIFAALLGRPRVGVDESFFELGGHSLLGTQVTSRLREAIGLEVPLLWLFEQPTARSLAALLAPRLPAGWRPAPRRVALTAAAGEELSSAQERLWFLDRLAAGGPPPALHLTLRLAGGLDPAALAAAIFGVRGVAARHAVLRSRFAAGEDGRPTATIDPSTLRPLPLADLAVLSAADRAVEAERLASREEARPFDLAQGTLLRALLVRLTGDRHRLLIGVHRIAADERSGERLAGEVAELYAAAVQRRAPRLPSLPWQLADFARWQRREVAGGALDGQLAYWRERLAGAPAALDLPLDRPRDRRRGIDPPAVAAGVPLSLPAELVARFGLPAPLQGIVLAGFAALLSRLSGQRDLVIGTAADLRDRPEAEPLVGPLANLLPLRLELAGRSAGDLATFRTLARRAADELRAGLAHRELPFERLLEELAPERHLGRAPVFQVLFTLDSRPPARLAMPGLTASLDLVGGDGLGLDLALRLRAAGPGAGGERAPALDGTLAYDPALLDAATAGRWAGHLATLLAGAAADPDLPLSRLPLLSAAERHQLLAEWMSPADPAPFVPLHGLFEAQAERAPQAVAVAGWGEAGEGVTYGELERWASRLADRLRALGAGPEAPIAVCVERSPAAVAALLAALKSGGAYLPLDPEYPEERLRRVLADAGAGIVLASRAQAGRAALAGLRVVPVERHERDARDEPGERSPARPAAAPRPVTPPESLAYILYTSGSTGAPRAAGVPHAAAAEHCRAIVRAFDLGPRDRVLQFAAPAFDVALEQALAALAAGAAVVLRDPEPWDPSDLLGKVAALRLSVVDLPTAYWQRWVRATAGRREEAPASLRLVIAGGEAMPAAAAREWRRTPMAAVRLLNAYGPTEAVMTASLAEVATTEGAGAAPLGRPLAGRAFHALDAAGELAPLGVPAELAIAGPLARGYLGEPAATAERFVPDPFGGPGARLYRTGDLVRVSPRGELDFLGRRDDQVKIRGFRIEPGEVEAALAGLGGIREAAVTVRDDLAGGPALVAYAVPEPWVRLDLAALREALRARLPEHLVPAHVVILPALPLTSTGKVDRRALPPPGTAAATPRVEPPAAEAGMFPAGGPLEERLAAIYAEVLERPTVGRDEGFFALGGHSLLATQVASRVRRALGVEMPVRMIFEHPTVAGLAAALAPRLPALAAPAAAAALLGPPEAAPGERVLSFAQERLWFLDWLLPGSSLYNVPLALDLAGDLDRRALATALTAVAARHETLRSTFHLAEGGDAQSGRPPGRPEVDRPVVRIAPPRALVPPLVDLSALPEGRRETTARALAEAESGRSFDLAHGPLLRALLLRTAERRHLALLTLHHIVTDGWSTGVLVREVAQLYAAARTGRRPRLPALAWQYGDFAAWQRQRLAGETLAAELAHWRQRLAGAPAELELPFDRPRPEVPAHRAGSVPIRLAAAPAERLAALAQEERATLFMVLLAAFQTLLGRTSGQDDVVVGTPIANRTRLETEPLIGFFVNTLALRAELAGEPPFRALLAQVRETTLAAYAHQELPFERLVEELNPERSLARTPLFQVLFSLQNTPGGSLELPGLSLAPLPLAAGGAKFDLSLFVSQEPSGLFGDLGYDAALFDAASARRLAAHLEVLLAGIAADPDRPISRLPRLTAAERQQIFHEWNAVAPTPDAAAPAGCLHELVLAQAQRTPEALAVVAADGRLTYGELAFRVGRLAAELRRRGVGPEVVVGIAAERSPAMVVGMLAILAAGGAYLPLDPSYPDERLAWVVADAGAALILATSAVALHVAGLLERPAGAAEPAGCPVVAIESVLAEAVGREAGAPPPLARSAGPQNLAYVLYTSGSTGRPKGVAIEHRSAVALLAWVGERYSAADLAGVVAVTSIGFDVAVFELFGPLAWGGTVLLAESALDLASPALAGAPSTPPVSLVNSVPSAFAELLHAGFAPPESAILQIAGEPVPRALVERLFERAPRARVFNLYGPTEDTTYSTVARIAPGDERAPSVGRPISGERALLLDAHGEAVPIGVAGEVHLGGSGLARGYLGRPDLTAARFVPDPWGDGARLYRTGDLARFRPDGEIDYLGRLDHQVKVRGFRVELGEIEAALVNLPGIVQAAVLAAGEAAERRLVAYVGAPDGEVEAGVLREGLRRLLPPQMVPSAFVIAAALPLNASGKVDRRALVARGAAPLERAEEGVYEPPSNPMEELLAEIWKDLLGIERVGVEDHFFDLGGHSLQGVRLMSRIAEVFGVRLPVRRIFEAPRLRELALVVAEEMLREAAALEVGQPA